MGMGRNLEAPRATQNLDAARRLVNVGAVCATLPSTVARQQMLHRDRGFSMIGRDHRIDNHALRGAEVPEVSAAVFQNVRRRHGKPRIRIGKWRTACLLNGSIGATPSAGCETNSRNG